MEISLAIGLFLFITNLLKDILLVRPPLDISHVETPRQVFVENENVLLGE